MLEKLSCQRLLPNVARRPPDSLWKAIIEKKSVSMIWIFFYCFAPSQPRQLWDWAPPQTAAMVAAVGPARLSYYGAANRSFGWKHPCVVAQLSGEAYAATCIWYFEGALKTFKTLRGVGVLKSCDQKLSDGFNVVLQFLHCGRAADMRILFLLYLAGRRRGTIFNKKKKKVMSETTLHAPTSAPNQTRK